MTNFKVVDSKEIIGVFVKKEEKKIVSLLNVHILVLLENAIKY